MLSHSYFINEEKGFGRDTIDVNYLLCYGLILCAGKPKDKVEVLFNILQEGGKEVHSFISATDNDFKPYFEKICLFATLHLFDFA